MTKYKCTDCGQEYDNILEACPNCGCPTFYHIMSKIKCADCGQEFDSAFDACPSCGCPKSNQAEQVQQDIKLSQSNAKQNQNKLNKKKLVFSFLILIITGIIAGGIIWYYGHSYELKIARYEKKADEFKSTLDTNCCILSEQIDSITQKVFYYVKESETHDEFGTPIRDILVHDLSTGETQSVLPTKSSIENFDLCGIQYRTSKHIENRLFLVIHSNCTWKYGATCVFYINTLDNSLHYVESCDNAEFVRLDEICIHKFYKIGYYDDKTDYKEYNLSTKLNDEAYAANRQKQKEIENYLAEEWRKEVENNRMKEWLYGTWESNGWDEWIGRYTSYVCLSENNLRFGYNGQDIYNGPYEIDMESHKIIFDRHDGYYTQIGFNPQTKRLEDESGVFRKVSNSGNGSYNSSSYGSRNSNYSSTVSFRTDTDVISYTSSHTFKNNAGNRIKINFQGMYVNGRLLTNAPRVLYFSGSSATISVSSPYNGGGAMIIRVDASRGTITDGSGDVFWMVN